MKKILGIVGTVAGVALSALGVYSLVKKTDDVVVEEDDFKGYNETEEADNEVESTEE